MNFDDALTGARVSHTRAQCPLAVRARRVSLKQMVRGLFDMNIKRLSCIDLPAGIVQRARTNALFSYTSSRSFVSPVVVVLFLRPSPLSLVFPFVCLSVWRSVCLSVWSKAAPPCATQQVGLPKLCVVKLSARRCRRTVLTDAPLLGPLFCSSVRLFLLSLPGCVFVCLLLSVCLCPCVFASALGL